MTCASFRAYFPGCIACVCVADTDVYADLAFSTGCTAHHGIRGGGAGRRVHEKVREMERGLAQMPSAVFPPFSLLSVLQRKGVQTKGGAWKDGKESGGGYQVSGNSVLCGAWPRRAGRHEARQPLPLIALHEPPPDTPALPSLSCAVALLCDAKRLLSYELARPFLGVSFTPSRNKKKQQHEAAATTSITLRLRLVPGVESASSSPPPTHRAYPA